jgi:hypothetical protein
MEIVLMFVWTWTMDLFQDEAMCHVQEIHGIDIFQDYASQGIVVHVLIWDPRGGVYDSSSMDGAYFCPTGGHGTPVLYLDGFSYFLRTRNILARRTVMSPLWDIKVL